MTLGRSRSKIPEATTWVDADATVLMALRAELKARGHAPGILAMIARFVVAGMARFPALNSRVDTERGEIAHLDGVNLGLAAGFGTVVLASVRWVAFKVGALSYGGGFVIIPLMRADAVDHYHWMTGGQFLNAVVLGQITPGPVVHTVAVVGYAAAGLPGGVLASMIAFSPSFAFILLGARHFDQLRGNAHARAFLAGAGPAAIGAIFGSAIPLALTLSQPWQIAVLAGALLLLYALRRGVVLTPLLSAAAGSGLTMAGLVFPQ